MTFMTSLIVLSVFLFSGIASAEKYLYVNTSGNLQNIEANNPTEAIAIASNIATHSGVVLDDNTSLSMGGIGGFIFSATSNTYLFVDTNGNLRTVVANNFTEAIAIASNIATHSGVMIAN